MAKTPKKKKKLSKEALKARRVQREHRSSVRGIFRNAGFVRFPKLADKEFSLDEATKSDFDDIFLFENLIVCAEYTTAKSISQHLKPKKIVYDHIKADPNNFLSILFDIDSDFKDTVLNNYTEEEIIIKIIYCSRYEFEEKYKVEVPNPIYLDYPELRYFKSVSDCIKISCRPELLAFLEVSPGDIGYGGKIVITEASQTFEGSLLPDANSNFGKGYKVVSFYADPESLIKRAYVLRRQGWRDSEGLYQRMILKTKIEDIRRHLRVKKRVFVNNIIVTLDGDTKIVDSNGDTINPVTITKTEQVRIQIPDRINTIGIIDGQHRTFSYYESSPDDAEIAKLRSKQNLLVTGIIYPTKIGQIERETFEARLFLEINSTQTNADSRLKQAINSRLQPFSDESIAKSVLDRLGRGSGPLSGQVERYWFDTDKLKTTSVVSYGLKLLVRPSGSDSLFSVWSNVDKDRMVLDNDEDLLREYVSFCEDRINELLISVRKKMPGILWTPARSTKGRLITTTTVNSLLICMRHLVENSKLSDVSEYDKRLSALSPKDFKGFHSSQYGRMAEKLYKKFFA